PEAPQSSDVCAADPEPKEPLQDDAQQQNYWETLSMQYSTSPAHFQALCTRLLNEIHANGINAVGEHLLFDRKRRIQADCLRIVCLQGISTGQKLPREWRCSVRPTLIKSLH